MLKERLKCTIVSSQSTSTDNDGRIPIAMGHLSDLGDLSDLDYYKVCLLNLFCILFKNKKTFIRDDFI